MNVPTVPEFFEGRDCLMYEHCVSYELVSCLLFNYKESAVELLLIKRREQSSITILGNESRFELLREENITLS